MAANGSKQAVEQLGDAPLNLLPLGLLDFFGIKSGGRYPQHLLAELQPGIDLYQHYLALAATTQLFTTAGVAGAINPGNLAIATAPGLPSTVLVGGAIVQPAGEVWAITDARVQWQLPNEAAAYGAFQLVFDQPGGAYMPITKYVDGYGTIGSATTARNGVAVQEQGVIFVGPSATLRILSRGSNSVANIGVDCVFKLVRMRL